MALLTAGHGTLAAGELASLLTGAGVESLVDIRRFPGSRRHPHFARERMSSWLPEHGVAYRWDERLGGRRKGVPGSPHTGLRDDSFRAYADWMETEEFGDALRQLVDEAGRRPTAVMCSESVWWRCHRRLVADAVQLLAGTPVKHLMHDGSLRPHQPTDGVRVQDGRLLYAE